MSRPRQVGARSRQTAELRHEFWTLFHGLWGRAHDNQPYDKATKDDWGRLQLLAHRLGIPPTPPKS